MKSESIDSACQREIIDYLTTTRLHETLSTFKRETLRNQGSTSSPISPSLQLQSLIAAHLCLNPQDEQDPLTDETSQKVLIGNRSDPTFDDEESDIHSNHDIHPTMDPDSTIFPPAPSSDTFDRLGEDVLSMVTQEIRDWAVGETWDEMNEGRK